jgi:hypothetical protein
VGILSPITAAGLTAEVGPDGQLLVHGSVSKLSQGAMQGLYAYIKTRKQEIIAALSQSGEPGQCETCPAAGFWDYAGYTGKRLCFYDAYFLGKPGRPIPCQDARAQCPRRQETGQEVRP